ncbi:hypothetical protein LJB42_004910 [Komagataella kurtzmanii]|nr:hypothetical protein LJB42_004910 [Komagataella kurtzmanii]
MKRLATFFLLLVYVTAYNETDSLSDPSSPSSCHNINHLPLKQQCSFVRENCQDLQVGTLNYFELYYCKIESPAARPLLVIPLTLGLMSVLFVSLGLTSSEFLCPNLSTISHFFDIPDNLSGLTLLAFGNGSPDIMGTYASFMSGDGSLAIGELIGSAYLITSFIVGAMVVVRPFRLFKDGSSDFTIRNEKLVFVRDLLFFALAVVLVIIFLSDRELSLVECLVMVSLYALYVAVIVSWNWIVKFNEELIQRDQTVRSLYDDDEVDGELNIFHQLNDIEVEENENSHVLNELMNVTGTQNNTSRIRSSVLGALEFKNVFENLSKEQSFPVDRHALINLRPESEPAYFDVPTDVENRPVTEPILAYRDGDYEARTHDIDLDVDDSENLKTLMSAFYKKRHSSPRRKFQRLVLLLIPTFANFKDSSWINKIFILSSAPIVLSLTLTIPVRLISDFQDIPESETIEGSGTTTNRTTSLRAQVSLLITQAFFSFLLLTFATVGTSDGFTIYAVFSLICSSIVSMIIYSVLVSPVSKSPTKSSNLVNIALSFIGFASSIAWISIFAEELINIFKFYSVFFKISEAILGLTIFAIGNSIGDFISNLTIAKMGMPLMALAACFGGPLLNLLMGIGVNGLITSILPPIVDHPLKTTLNIMSSTTEETIPANEDIELRFQLIQKSVSHFDPRFTLKVFRELGPLRRRLDVNSLLQVVEKNYPQDENRQYLKDILVKLGAQSSQEGDHMEVDSGSVSTVLPEIDIFIHVLILIYLHDHKEIKLANKFVPFTISALKSYNRRTLDYISSRAWFYIARIKELAGELTSIRPDILLALRTSTLRHDIGTRASTITLLLRNYILSNDINQASNLVEKTEFPEDASNALVARYYYYLARIHAVQLAYSTAHNYAVTSIRKAPQSELATGFLQTATKLNILVELLMGEIPSLDTFRDPKLEKSLLPYLAVTRAVRLGDLNLFNKALAEYGDTFKDEKNYNLVLKLRQNVIKTGIRIISLAYTRISLKDICIKLHLDSELSAEYIVAKSIRDGVIEATIDHEKGYMQSKEVLDVYSTREPQSVFDERIKFCMQLHNESVKAMRYPLSANRIDNKNAPDNKDSEEELLAYSLSVFDDEL